MTRISPMEAACQQHAAEQRRYDRSRQAVIDRAADAARRAAADKKAGHLPTCSLTKCAPGCPKSHD
jgi:hypothetical protein